MGAKKIESVVQIDRRKGEKSIIPRQFDLAERTFYYTRKVYLTDTNSFSNVYFAQYFDFMGEAREELLKYVLGANTEQFMKSGLVLLTLDASLKYKNSCYIFDEIRINIKLNKLTKTRIFLDFEILNLTREQTAAGGSMSVAIAKDGKPIALPAVLHSKVEALFINGLMSAHQKNKV